MTQRFVSPGGGDKFYDRSGVKDTDLDGLMARVLDALEESNPAEHKAANNDPALSDRASESQKKAWLAVYGPLTNVL